MTRRLSIKSKIAMLAILAMAVLTLLVTTMQWVLVERDLKGVLSQQLRTLTRQAAAELDEKLRLRRDALTASASVYTANVLSDPAKTGAVLAQMRATSTLFDSLFVTDENGRILYDLPAAAGRRNLVIADREYFQRAMRTGHTAISAPVVGRATKAPQINIA
ncbi:MAG TPA: hypothetical protein VFS42_05955, partial [Burkholderiaceae bacterium]|nr:hypothetical protein [Burkholderiaceae bacterium]